MVRRGAGLNTNEAPRQLLEKGQDVTALQLTTDDHLSLGVDAVDLKY